MFGRFIGDVVEVEKTGDRQELTQFPDCGPRRIKGCTQRGALFNRDYISPRYNVTLRNSRGTKRRFTVAPDNPPVIGVRMNYRMATRGSGLLFD